MLINKNYGYHTIDGIEMFGCWISDKNGKKFEPKGRAIHIDDIAINMEDNFYTLILSFTSFSNKITHELKLEDFNKSGLLKLAKYGADVTENNVLTLVNVLQDEKNRFEISKTYTPKHYHTHLGWDKFKNQPIFKGFNVISKKDTNGIPFVTSKYDGEYYITPKGDYKQWKELIKEQVIGNAPLELAVIIGLSAVVNAYVGKQFDCDNLLIHLLGESTTGKTTAGILALSTSSVSMPNVDNKETHMRTWNSTKNALLQCLNGNHGFPVLFDEFSMNKDYSITDLIYSLIYGKDKSRLNGDSEQKFTKDFRTTIISTGEASMLNKTSKNTGLLVRLIEFSNIQWTTSAEQSIKIKKVCKNNCGFAIYKVANYLLNTPLDEIEQEFYTQKQLYLNNTTIENEFTERIATKYAMLLLTSKIVSKVLKLDFNHDKILQLLLDNERDTLNETPSNVGERAYKSLLEYISTNHNHFVVNDEIPNLEIYGELNSSEIVIPKGNFAKIMKSIGFEDTKTIIKKWKEIELLNHEQGRNTRTRKITNESSSVLCYVINRQPEDDVKHLKPNFLKNQREGNKLVEAYEILDLSED